MFVIEGYKELIKDLKQQIESLQSDNDDLREENRGLREELKSSSENPSELVDRVLSMSEAYDNLCAINRELKYKLADYENAEKIMQGRKKEDEGTEKENNE